MLLCIVSFLAVANVVESQWAINSLPGFSGNLPFKLETGYVGVGELDDVQLFYYFIESERSPEDDALVLWLTGGPGCSAFSALVFELGPLSFDYENSETNSPKLKLNPYSWTKVANIIFVDEPVGAGFSYAKTSEGYNISDTLAVAELYDFLRKWLKAHPRFLKNPLYIMGDSYSGIITPILVQEISDGNEVGREPPLNLMGYALGNPLTDRHDDLNARIPFAHLKCLISDQLYESTKMNCKGEYINVDPSNAPCVDDLKAVTKCTEKIYIPQILEPICQLLSPKPEGSKWDPEALNEDSTGLLQSISHLHEPRRWCREYNYLYSYIWANDKTVQKALHIREGSVSEWVRCNESLVYTYDVSGSLNYHRNLIKKGYQVLIYSGDHDMTFPYIATHGWIESLNLTISSDWRPWFVDGQVAGYTMKYKRKKYYLTFATVKGGGHTAPQFKPSECLAMIDRWLSYYPL
ncbi:serine carboxypeptidase-like 2 [Alnus glutinosa]|uniref:serine carboxypeptidase-like 2 n=1 Tax=Alnus glutinosa TaxID=3517 RepID=UPI002D7962FF|nr:serine carboxypeptidase-like 2 [Alnus glutinosa]